LIIDILDLKHFGVKCIHTIRFQFKSECNCLLLLTNMSCFSVNSMGAFLLSAGTKGKWYSLPNSRIMIHQPLGGAQGGQTDIDIQVLCFFS
ncbi:hypothetical protein V6Z11_D03G043900, partial [Gossypium hirsutum]